ncbi:MAG TPA: hypothetical protein VHY22_03115 [Chthoniobacteraceae bacterium]|jgi:hypothetical protein|nr:hypothetical protein [Chthoniobacteraceae bacterium]
MPFTSLRRVLACLLLLPALAGCHHTPPGARDPETAADTFFAQVAKGNAHAAYDSTAFGFQAAQTYEAFSSNAQELGLVGAQPPAWATKEIHENDARLQGKIVSPSGTAIPATVTLTKEGDAWKLFSLETNTTPGTGETEDRFSLVGKGSGFNDVYHQPMPTPAELDALVHDTMTKFNTAITTGDFRDFYKSVSQQWKNGERNTGEAAAGVTENMLKNHFQAFIDKKVVLSGVASAPVVFDKPPIINDQGLLYLEGHLDLSQFRVNFQLEYAYELPRWKLFGVNLSLTR